MAGSSLTITDLDNNATTAPVKRVVKISVPKPVAPVTNAQTVAKKSTHKKVVTKKTAAKKPAAKKSTPQESTPKKKAAKAVTKKQLPRAALGKKKVARKTAQRKGIKKAVTAVIYPPKYVLKRDEVPKREPNPPVREPETTLHPKREPLGHLLVEQLLSEAGFAGGVSSDKEILDRYTHDESIFAVRPQIVLQPKNQRDVEIAVKVLGKETKRFPALSLTPRAAGTGLSGGSLTDSVVVDVTKHLQRIEEPVTVRGDTTITCEPGAFWKDVERKLKKKGVYLPSYPASKDLCTIGGAVANNAAGPDSLRFGHMAAWVEAINVTLYDGNTYTIKPLTYQQYQTLIKKNHAHAQLARDVFALIEQHEKHIESSRPKTSKNSAGYALWDVLSGSVASFKRGKATFDLTRIFSGSQGTIGIITSITLRTEPIRTDTELIAIPLFDLLDAGKVITKVLDYNPINVELFDGLTMNLAMSNPQFFKDRLGPIEFYKVMFALYSLYHVRYLRKVPEFTILVTLDHATIKNRKIENVVKVLRSHRARGARHITSRVEKEMFWQLRRASYSLSKFQDKNKRPAAFLEDMTVPPEHLAKFFVEIKKLLQKYNVTAAVHGHGGDGHLHFYPLLDFTQQSTRQLVPKMAEEFFAAAVKFGGTLCGEHNDGIIRTPHLNKMFDKKMLSIFAQLERLCDPDDIFNPGKKTNPRFDIETSMRRTN